MWGGFLRRPLLGGDLSAWQFECFGWLLRNLGGLPALVQRRVVQPTPAHFPQRSGGGPVYAERVFAQVKVYAGMGEWPCELRAQQADPDPHVAPALLVQGAPGSPAGTFRVQDGTPLITYHPRQLRDPMSLVATFAHELAHLRTAGFSEPPPGGWELWEPATDLAAVFLGFGIFMANARFQFAQHGDAQSIGWQWRVQGYLTEPELLHAHAICCTLRGDESAQTLPHLKPALRGMFRRVSRDVRRCADGLSALRAVPSKSV